MPSISWFSREIVAQSAAPHKHRARPHIAGTSRNFRAFCRGFSCRRFLLPTARRGAITGMFFETAAHGLGGGSQANVWEPRANRGRLRHCNGIQALRATGPSRIGKAEQGHARSQDTGWTALVGPACCGTTSPSREGWGRSPFRRVGMARALNAFIRRA